MRGFKIILPIFILLISYSCRKDELNNYTNTAPTVPAYAGVYDSSFFHLELSTPLNIPVTWDSLNLYGFGSDSLDLNNDGEIDMTISMSLLNDDSLHLLTAFPDPFPYLRVKLKSQFEILTYSEYTYIGQGSGYSSKFVKDLVYGQRIDTLPSYYNAQSGYSMWQENPSQIGPSFGNLYYINSLSYIAFKHNDDKFGWIKVDMTDNKNPIFLSFAVQL